MARQLLRKPFLLLSAHSSPPKTLTLTLARRFSQPRSMAHSSSEPFQKIQITRDDTAFDAYVVGRENAPGIVVLQEWWGVDFEVKNHALKIAGLGSGYRALIPDLYRGKVGLDVAEAQHLMEGLDWQGAVKDIGASVKWLKANGSPKMNHLQTPIITAYTCLQHIKSDDTCIVEGQDVGNLTSKFIESRFYWHEFASSGCKRQDFSSMHL